MKEHKIKFKSTAIKKCIEDAIIKNDFKIILNDIDKKINRLLYRENIDRKLLEQLFSNMGNQINEIISDDTCLREYYKTNDDLQERLGI